MSDSERTTQNSGGSSPPQALGAYLMGMIASFENTRILDITGLPFDPASLSSDDWYPFDYALSFGELIDNTLPASSSLLFWAGVKFMEIWYWQGPGKEIISSSQDWVLANQAGDGYNSVVKGAVNDVGWTKGLELNLEEGHALIESVMPWCAEYQRGVLFGGFMLFNDASFFNIEIISSKKEPTLPFPRTVFKFTFKLAKDYACDTDDAEVSGNGVEYLKNHVSELRLHAEHKQRIYALREQYIQEMECLLKNSISELKKSRNELMDLNRQLSIEATTDSLTGLANKRYFYQQVKHALSTAKRRGLELLVFIIDIDHFKEFNDHYGHLEGDKAIVEVADVIKNVFKRGEDICCRFGGEEFICVSMNESEQEVFALAEKIQSEVGKKRITHASSDVSDFLTVSIGSTVGRDSATNIDKLLVLADRALYQAKSQGRNRHLHV